MYDFTVNEAALANEDKTPTPKEKPQKKTNTKTQENKVTSKTGFSEVTKGNDGTETVQIQKVTNNEAQTKAEVVKKAPPNYTFKTLPHGSDITGQVYADGKLIKSQDYYSYYSYSSYNAQTQKSIDLKGEPAVIASMKNEAKIMGFYSNEGTKYEANPTIQVV
jgi:hypothetical protein